jgi:hypothetical protein
LRERNRLAKIGLGQFCLTLFQPQFATYSKNLGLVNEFLWIRSKLLFDRFQRLDGGALPSQLGRRQTDAQAYPKFESYRIAGVGVGKRGHDFGLTQGGAGD